MREFRVGDAVRYKDSEGSVIAIFDGIRSMVMVSGISGAIMLPVDELELVSLDLDEGI